MQSSHTWKAGTAPAPHHEAAHAHHGPVDVLALGFSGLLILGIPLLALVVFYRAFRWFWRATR